MSLNKLLERRPETVKEILGSKSKVCLLNGHEIFNAIREQKIIIMACNPRIKHIIAGIMKGAMDTDAVVAFELAKSESDLKGGYTGMTPKDFFEAVISHAEELGFDKPFCIHADHLTVKSAKEDEIRETEKLIEEQLRAGYTSFAIDASFNPEEDNIRITSRLAKPILERRLGLETEVGEIKAAGSSGELTTVEEARSFVEGLVDNGIIPDLLGINNGSKHGNYLEGEEISIDLERTAMCYGAVKEYGVCIAQHGITGTPLHLVGRFADYGIRKGNVGTEWQNIAHRNLPDDLMDRMKAWSKEAGKDIKYATKQFLNEIDSIPDKYKRGMENEARRIAVEFIRAFRAEGSAAFITNALGR